MGCVVACQSKKAGWDAIFEHVYIPVAKQRKLSIAREFFSFYASPGANELVEGEIENLLRDYFQEAKDVHACIYAHEFGRRLANVVDSDTRLKGVSYDVLLEAFEKKSEPFVDVCVQILDPESGKRTIRKNNFMKHMDELFLCSDKPLADESEMNEIIPNFFLGSEKAAMDKDMLDRNGITHVLTIGWHLAKPHEKHFKYLYWKEVLDSPSQELFEFFEPSHKFLEECLIEEKGKVLVHCQLGVSRSATIVLGMLMRLNNWNFFHAYEYVKSRRIYIDPNIGFQTQLEEFCQKGYTYDLTHYKSFDLEEAIVNKMDWGLQQITDICELCEEGDYERMEEMRYFTLLFASTHEVEFDSRVVKNIQKKAVEMLRFFQTEFVMNASSLESFDKMFNTEPKDEHQELDDIFTDTECSASAV